MEHTIMLTVLLLLLIAQSVHQDIIALIRPELQKWHFVQLVDIVLKVLEYLKVSPAL